MRTTVCPDCHKRLRPCNLTRHRRAHMPKAVSAENGVRFVPSSQPLTQGKPKNDRRYDEIAPRGIGPYRYRLYRLRGGNLDLLAAVETAQALGEELVAQHIKGAFAGGDDSVGILDTATEPGKWISNPWTLGRRTE